MMFGKLYRRPLTRDEALIEVERCSGTQFDPRVVRAFFAAVGLGEAVGV
jgi:HD-GYP domain-containing protein (c-di-GMP phosphodiesterase class II)